MSTIEEDSTIEQYYDTTTQVEWQRLERHKMEIAVTLRALKEYLPAAPRKILDIGGGPGRYALALSTQHYQVTLLDLSRNNLALAQQKAQEQQLVIEEYVHGNALRLNQFAQDSFDAVLLLGPLYHLWEQQERELAIREAMRVLRPGGLIFAAFITRFAAFRNLAKHAPEFLIEEEALSEEILSTGLHRGGPGIGFTRAYFAHPDEIKPLMASQGCELIDLIGCEGIISQLEERINLLEGASWQAWVELNYRLGHEPSLYGAADHLLYVGRKPATAE